MDLISPFFLFVFFPLTVLVFILLRAGKTQELFLLFISLFFIYLFGENKLYLVVFLLIINYFGARGLSFCFWKKTRAALITKLVFFFLVFLNVFVLIFFKYVPSITTAFSIQIEQIIKISYLPFTIGHINILQKIIFPIGLSFLTFSMISYLIDVYSGKIEAEKNLLDFALYATFFPKFVAGPIERYESFSKQIKKIDSRYEDIYEGFLRFAVGVSKKILIVSALSRFTSPIFELDPKEWNFQITWVALFLYTLQIYIDFDAYSDMAIGMARIFGIRLMENFNNPYLAISIQDFWQRWHISLSTWLRDYILMPFNFLVRKKSPKWLFVMIGLLITFIISGVWHGNSRNFFFWGLYFGILLSIESIFLKENLQKIPNWLKRILTFVFVMISWVFFRIDNFQSSISFLSKMFILQEFKGDFYRSIIEFYKPEVIITTLFAILLSFGFLKKIKTDYFEKNDLGRIIYSFLILILLAFSIMRIYSGYQETFLYATF